MEQGQSREQSAAVEQTRCWVKTVIVEHNFCPFARRELERDSIRYRVSGDVGLEPALRTVIEECVHLDNNDATETTLLIFKEGFANFGGYLDLVDLAQALIVEQGYEGTYQLASFHPDYCFEGAEPNDAANYTNRSPYPMLHLIREASMARALEHYPEPEKIPERNVEYARELGLDEMQRQLEACCKIEK